MMKFIDWLENQANIIGLSPQEIAEKSHMNINNIKNWKNNNRKPTTGSIIILVQTISKLRKDVTYRELITEAILIEGQA